MMYLRTVCVTSVLAHCTVIHSDIEYLNKSKWVEISHSAFNV